MSLHYQTLIVEFALAIQLAVAAVVIAAAFFAYLRRRRRRRKSDFDGFGMD